MREVFPSITPVMRHGRTSSRTFTLQMVIRPKVALAHRLAGVNHRKWSLNEAWAKKAKLGFGPGQSSGQAKDRCHCSRMEPCFHGDAGECHQCPRTQCHPSRLGQHSSFFPR
ncbi:hypothetical protein AOLI_G00053340 [Acnodon oligacanthus]